MFNKEKLAPHHGLLALVIALLLFFLLIALVFKTGMMVGGSKSYYSSGKAGNHYKNFSGHMGGKFSSWKKSEYEAFEVQVVITNSGEIDGVRILSAESTIAMQENILRYHHLEGETK